MGQNLLVCDLLRRDYLTTTHNMVKTVQSLIFFYLHVRGHEMIKNPLRFKRFLLCEPDLTVEAAIGLDQGRRAAMTDTAHCTKDKYMD